MKKQIISVVNHKGGVGKTTTAVNVSACWGKAGRKVLLVDLDPQGSASMSLGVRDEGEGLLNALQATEGLPVAPTAAEGVDLVPAGPKLAVARQRFSGSLGTELMSKCLKRTLIKGQWDPIVIDCPPSLGILTTMAMWASSHVLITAEANFLALGGLNQILETITSVRERHPELEIMAVVPCRAHPRRRIHRETMEKLEEAFPGKVSPAVRENVSLAEAPGRGMPVIMSAPRSHGAEDYQAVASFLLKHLR